MLSSELVHCLEAEETQGGISATKPLMVFAAVSNCSSLQKLRPWNEHHSSGYMALEVTSSSQEINTSQSELIEKVIIVCVSQGHNWSLYLNYPLGMNSLDYQMVQESYWLERRLMMFPHVSFFLSNEP